MYCNGSTVEPTVQWSGGSVGSENGVMVGDTTHSGVMSMKTLTFSPLCTSHQGDYICQATINTTIINENLPRLLHMSELTIQVSNFS